MSFKLWFCRKFYRVAIEWWRLWSKAYRKIWHGKWKGVPLPALSTPQAVAMEFRKLRWVGDSAQELWDACGSPRWVAHCLAEVNAGRPQPAGALDCDDFASLASSVLEKYFAPMLLTVAWLDEKGALQGHAVTAVRLPVNQGVTYVDQGGVRATVSHVGQLVNMVLPLRYARDRGVEPPQLVGWALLTPELQVVRWGTSEVQDTTPWW